PERAMVGGMIRLVACGAGESSKQEAKEKYHSSLLSSFRSPTCTKISGSIIHGYSPREEPPAPLDPPKSSGESDSLQLRISSSSMTSWFCEFCGPLFVAFPEAPKPLAGAPKLPKLP